MCLQQFSNETKDRPMALHVSPIGLIRLGVNNDKRFNRLNQFLNEVHKHNGNIALPTFSYSYVNNEIYNMQNTCSRLDVVSEYLRKKNKLKRTADPNFSYLLFGNNFSNEHFKVQNYNSFGNNSLIDELYTKDGYLGAIGGILEHLTEIHYLERRIKVHYRSDKIFEGVTIDRNKDQKTTSVEYFCRFLDSDYVPSFAKLKQDLRKYNIVKKWHIEKYNLRIEVVKFKDVLSLIKDKIKDNPEYLLKKKLD